MSGVMVMNLTCREEKVTRVVWRSAPYQFKHDSIGGSVNSSVLLSLKFLLKSVIATTAYNITIS